jgi:hypothetical protein
MSIGWRRALLANDAARAPIHPKGDFDPREQYPFDSPGLSSSRY